MKRRDPDYVTGQRGNFQIQPPIEHPPFCSCTKCGTLPIEERGRAHEFRIRRASPFPDNRVDSAVYARGVKRDEEAKLRGTVPTLSTSGETSFSALADIYLAEHGPSMATRSLERDEGIIDLHLRPAIGDVAIAELKAIHIRRYQRLRQENGASPATVNREWNTIRAILNFAEQNELIERNPIRRGAVPPVKTSGPRKDFFEPEEWRRFLAALNDDDRWRRYLQELRDKKPVRLVRGTSFGSGTRRPESDASKLQLERLREVVPIFRALFYTASRAGEILAANREDADRRHRLITVRQEKTGIEKTLPLVEPLDEMIAALPPATSAAPLFTRSDGRRFYVLEVERAFAIALELAQIKKPLTPHSIRHTVGSWLTIAGVPEIHVGEVLGHKRRSTTSGYSHLAPASLLPVMEKLVTIERDGLPDHSQNALIAETRSKKINGLRDGGEKA